MQLLVTIVLLIAFAAYLLVPSASVKEVARWIAGISAIVLALILILG